MNRNERGYVAVSDKGEKKKIEPGEVLCLPKKSLLLILNAPDMDARTCYSLSSPSTRVV